MTALAMLFDAQAAYAVATNVVSVVVFVITGGMTFVVVVMVTVLVGAVLVVVTVAVLVGEPWTVCVDFLTIVFVL